jgi:hypothetical protein
MKHQTSTERPESPNIVIVFVLAVVMVALFFFIVAAVLPDSLPKYWINADFANYWIAARLSLEGRALDLFRGHDVYFAHMQEVFGPDYPWRSWSYPPHYLLLIAPLGLVNYLPAAILFMSVTLLLLVHALSLAVPKMPWWVAVLILPAVFCNLILMQNGFLTSALILYGLALREKRPVLAGIAIGILTVKPQLGFLFPILLCFERRWLVIASASLTAVVMVGLSATFFGVEAWTGYMTITLSQQTDVMLHLEGAFADMIPSVFGSFRSLRMIEPETALRVHMIFAVAVFCFFLWSLAKAKTSVARATNAVFATFLVTPYSVSYDLAALSAIAAVQLRYASAFSPSRTDRYAQWVILCAFFALPVFVYELGAHGLPISPLIIAAAWLVLIAMDRHISISEEHGPFAQKRTPALDRGS